MKASFNGLIPFRFLFSNTHLFYSFLPKPLSLNPSRFLTKAVLPFHETLQEQEPEQEQSQSQAQNLTPETEPKNASDLLRKWGCNEDDMSKIFQRRPSLQRMEVSNLKSKLKILTDLGICSSDLAKIVNCRPRFLNGRINQCMDGRLEFFRTLFGTREVLIKAIVRNPSLLTYDFHKQIKPVVSFYEQLGFSRSDLITMLIARPTLIPRTSLDDEKMDCVRRTGVQKGTSMYKYVISLFAISRLETIREKVANLEKHGFTEDEVYRLFGKSPLLLTLSVDKVQRNMTFILGTMKLSANLVRDNPCLLFLNLDTVIKPRFCLGEKIDDMGLLPRVKGSALLRAMRMTDKRFIEAFIDCHPKDVARELMEYYKSIKCVRRLAESSKKHFCKGFPF